MMRRYWTDACKTCALKTKCTTGPERRVARWEHEAVLLAYNIKRVMAILGVAGLLEALAA